VTETVIQTVQIDNFVAVTLGFAVFLLGYHLNKRLRILAKFNIPEPVTGGLLAALATWGVFRAFAVEIEFSLAARDYLLVVFFAAIGLNARLSDLVAGGRPLLLLLALTLGTIIAQNIIGVIGAVSFGLPAQAGVLFGSASLIGGHGTAIAWSPAVQSATGLEGAGELGVAVATLGLVLAALVGGPVAKYLIDRNNLTSADPDGQLSVGIAEDSAEPVTQITHTSIMRIMLVLNISIALGALLHGGFSAVGLKLPLFVPCLIMGIVVGNLLSLLFPGQALVSRTPALALISDFALGTFLAMSLMSLQLWTLAAMGMAIFVILGVQVLLTVALVIFGLFVIMGRDYLSAVLAAGFAGFALGATPTAIANMTAVTKHYGPAPIAFVVLPLVSAFFVDLANAVVIQTIVNF